MKQILRNSLYKFLAFICLTIITLGVSSLKKKFPYALNKSDRKIYSLKNIDVGIYGHSHSKGGIDASYLGKVTNQNVFNFSNAGTSLFYNIRLIENNLKFNPQQLVILEIGSNNLGYNGMIRSLIDSEYDQNGFIPYKHYLAANYQFLKFKDLQLFFHLSPFNTLQSLIKGSFIFPNLYSGIDINEPNLINSINKIDSLKSSINQKWDKLVPVNFEFDALKELILKYPETPFLLLRIPEHPLSLKVYDNEKRFDSLKQVYSAIENVEFKDYSYIIFDTIDYKDISHLSKYGMQKFSDTLARDNKSLFKTK